MLTYKRKLILTKSQQIRIDNWIGTCRFVYNMALEIRIEAWKNKQESVGKFELMKQLTTIKNIDWIADVPAQSLQNVIERLDNSYNRFFKGAGFPKWANKRYYKSILFKQNSGIIKLSVNNINLPKIGKVKMFKDAHIMGNIKAATIKKELTGYFITIVTDVVKDIQNKDENQVIGLDMGLSHFCIDSNGNFIANPKHFKKYERQLRIENRSLVRKKKGSNSWKRQCKKLSLLHHKIANIRKDFLHKESTKIAKNFHTVYIEDLNVSGMSKNGNLSKHILDAGWGMFGEMIAYKTNCVKVNARHTSQTCNKCGYVDAKNRISQSLFICLKCGNEDNADFNAAKNIEGKGITLDRQREAIVRA
jgi:putative transposase